MRDANKGIITEHQYQRELERVEREHKAKERLEDL